MIETNALCLPGGVKTVLAHSFINYKLASCARFCLAGKPNSYSQIFATSTFSSKAGSNLTEYIS